MNRVDDMPGYILALLCAAAMATVSYLCGCTLFTRPDAGICFPPAETWIPLGFISFPVQFGVLWVASAGMTSLNRKYNLEPGTSALPASFFLVATASVPAVISGFWGASLMALALIMCLHWICYAFERPDTTRQMFLCASTLSFGAMIQYGFMFLAVALLMGILVLREINFRSLCAMIFGLITPWLLVMGFGFVAPSDILIPWLYSPAEEIPLMPILAAGITALTGIFLTMRRAVVPSMSSIRIVTFNRMLAVVLLTLVAVMGADYNNFTVYIPSLAMLTGFLVAGTGSNRSGQLPTVLTVALSLVYIILFAITVLL